MKKSTVKWIITAIMLAVICLMAGSLFMNYIRINLSAATDLGVVNLDALFDLLENIGLLKDKSFLFSTDSLLRGFSRLLDLLNEDTQAGSLALQLVRFLMVVVLTPYIALIPELIFSLIRRWWSYLITMLIALTMTVFVVVSVMWFMPNRIWNSMNEIVVSTENAVEDAVGDTVDSIGSTVGDTVDSVSSTVDQISDVIEGLSGFFSSSGSDDKFSLSSLIKVSSVRSTIVNGLGPAFWIVVIGNGVLTVLSLIGMIVALREKKREPADASSDAEDGGDASSAGKSGNDNAGLPAQAADLSAGYEPPTGGWENQYNAAKYAGQTGLLFQTGEMAGAVIPLTNEWISIGSDPSQCSVVIRQPRIAPLHCIICFIPSTGQYNLVDKSGGMTFLDSKPVRQGEIYSLRKGTPIAVGSSENRIILL